MSLDGGVPDARLDPWCVVPLVTGNEILFGFASWHPATGGRSWTRSTPVVALNQATGRARTWSGRLYELGRHIDPEDVPAEGQEAWAAYDLLIGPDAHDADAVPPVSADHGLDAVWLASCKMARHLGVPPPARTPAQVNAFLRRHVDAYVALRARRRLQ